MNSSPHEERDATVARLIETAKRRGGGVPLRRSLVQGGNQGRPVPGPLHRMVRDHDERALDLYLLLRLRASSEDWDVRLDARVWSRAMGLPTSRDTGAGAISKVWQRLDTKYQLVSRERAQRLARITVLDESGSGAAYSYPSGGTGEGRYFKLPLAYWASDEHYYRTLSLAAKAMLLIASSLKPGFALPVEKLPDWYGISTETGRKGLKELRDAGLLTSTPQRRDDPLLPEGYLIEHRHTLLAPFHQNWATKPLAPVTSIGSLRRSAS